MVWIILIFFLLSIGYASVILHYHREWNKISDYQPGTEGTVFISVIVPARNEEDNLPALIHALQSQDYPLFEVIIVNDHSTDATENILQSIHDPRFRDINLSDHVQTGTNAYKKKAIEIAILHAKGELIVNTDADCIPGRSWLSTISAFYTETNAQCIAAPVCIEPGKTFLGIFQSTDFCTLQGITAAAVHSKMHMMCNGANFIYTKKAFEQVKGFSGIDHIPTGDDMLLMQKIYDLYPNKVHYLKSRNAIVNTAAAKNWKTFLHQRIRWASKSTDYSDKKITNILMVVYFFNLFFLVTALCAFWFEKGWMLLILFLLFKILLEFPFIASVAGFFGLSKLKWYFPLLQPIHILYTIIAGWLGKFGSYQWKGRTIKTALK
jgi:poly-beta-1,6-N-acetyl-D-glucosamine synthase